MKTLGLIGGMSWESTQTYYQGLNEKMAQRLGGLNSASLILHSVNFADIAAMQKAGQWSEMGQRLATIATHLQQAGADAVLICTNTMHKLAPDVETKIHIPLLHIADATGQALVAAGIQKVGLLGTQFTMEQAFYKQRLMDRFDLQVIIPAARQRETVHRIIFDELCLGQCKADSKQAYLDIIGQLVIDGAQAVILGCTEIGLLVQQSDTSIPLFDTTTLHIDAAVSFALQAPSSTPSD